MEDLHPQQQIRYDSQGVKRFRVNRIVQYVLDRSNIDMNRLSELPFDRADRIQFAQLLGYSVNGYRSLPYATDIEE